MAITFIQKRKTQRYLVLVFSAIILLIIIVVWWGFFKEEKPPLEEVFQPPKKVKINFEVLKNPVLEEFQPFEVIQPFEEETGRKNPFVPY